MKIYLLNKNKSQLFKYNKEKQEVISLSDNYQFIENKDNLDVYIIDNYGLMIKKNKFHLFEHLLSTEQINKDFILNKEIYQIVEIKNYLNLKDTEIINKKEIKLIKNIYFNNYSLKLIKEKNILLSEDIMKNYKKDFNFIVSDKFIELLINNDITGFSYELIYDTIYPNKTYYDYNIDLLNSNTNNDSELLINDDYYNEYNYLQIEKEKITKIAKDIYIYIYHKKIDELFIKYKDLLFIDKINLKTKIDNINQIMHKDSYFSESIFEYNDMYKQISLPDYDTNRKLSVILNLKTKKGIYNNIDIELWFEHILNKEIKLIGLDFIFKI